MVTPLQPGHTVLKRYRIEQQIADGGQALVYRAQDRKTRQTVAVKQLAIAASEARYAEHLSRFQRSAAMRIGHAHVIDPIDGGQDKDGNWYIIMPFIEGQTLEQYVSAAGGKLAIDDALGCIEQLAGAFDAIHAQHIVHRDVKPQNILVDASNNLFVIDLGICKCASQQTIAGHDGYLGTIDWSSPEQIAYPKEVDWRSDLYVLGAIAYWMLAGQSPAKGNDINEVVRQICMHQPPPLRSLNALVPEHVERAIAKMLSKSREDRYDSGQSFVQALQGLMPEASAPSVCAGCGADLSRLALAGLQPRFCHHCGLPVDAGTSQPELCLACGTFVSPASAACNCCGREFGPVPHRLEFGGGGALAGQVFRVPQGNYDVGRQQLAPRDLSISRRHFCVACSNGAVLVQDAASANKTLVDGHLARIAIELRDRCLLAVAGHSAVYRKN